MILQHPIDGHKIVIKWNDPAWGTLKRVGWKDVTPAKTEKQRIQQKRWALLGLTLRTSANLSAMFCQKEFKMSQAELATLTHAQSTLLAVARRERIMNGIIKKYNVTSTKGTQTERIKS